MTIGDPWESPLTPDPVTDTQVAVTATQVTRSDSRRSILHSGNSETVQSDAFQRQERQIVQP